MNGCGMQINRRLLCHSLVFALLQWNNTRYRRRLNDGQFFPYFDGFDTSERFRLNDEWLFLDEARFESHGFGFRCQRPFVFSSWLRLE